MATGRYGWSQQVTRVCCGIASDRSRHRLRRRRGGRVCNLACLPVGPIPLAARGVPGVLAWVGPVVAVADAEPGLPTKISAARWLSSMAVGCSLLSSCIVPPQRSVM
jgi:hypothetical protein